MKNTANAATMLATTANGKGKSIDVYLTNIRIYAAEQAISSAFEISARTPVLSRVNRANPLATGSMKIAVPANATTLATTLVQDRIIAGGVADAMASLTATLALAGVSAGDALVATAVYRMVSFFLPMIVGLIAYPLMTRRGRRKAAAGPPPP